MDTPRLLPYSLVSALVAFTTVPAQEADMETHGYGFRLDPMAWIDSAGTIQAAQVRTVLLGRHLPGDTELLQREIQDILGSQDANGALGDNTAGRLIRLQRLGCSPDRAEVQRAVGAMCRDDGNDDGLLGPYEIQAAVWGGHDDADLLGRSVQALIDQVMELDFWCACPWTGEVHLQGLWSGRQYADVSAALERGLQVGCSRGRHGLPPVPGSLGVSGLRRSHRPAGGQAGRRAAGSPHSAGTTRRRHLGRPGSPGLRTR